MNFSCCRQVSWYERSWVIKLCEETIAEAYFSCCQVCMVEIHIKVFWVRHCVVWYGLVVSNHIHGYTASEMKPPQSRNWATQVYHKIIPHWRVNYGSAMKWIQKHCVDNCLFVHIYRLSLHRSVVHNENMLQNKCLKQTMYAFYINLQPFAVSKMEASLPSTGLPLMALV